MSKFQISVCVAIIAIFIGIIIVSQSNSSASKAKPVPTLPADADVFKQITPTAIPQQQGYGQANGPRPTFGVEEELKATYAATIKTTKGNIEVYLSGHDAPRTVKNFLEKAHSGYYKNLTFHRVEDWVVQGGDPKGDGTGGGLMQTELNSLEFVTGSLGVARGSNINVSNDSQFFIVKKDSPHLTQQYTNFGIVTKGMDVVNKIQAGDKILSITPVDD
jgi:peptidyl-prolyl cis-trans isomerase B (cyclophilin B)